jgi:hypothetical protein
VDELAERRTLSSDSELEIDCVLGESPNNPNFKQDCGIVPEILSVTRLDADSVPVQSSNSGPSVMVTEPVVNQVWLTTSKINQSIQLLIPFIQVDVKEQYGFLKQELMIFYGHSL